MLQYKEVVQFLESLQIMPKTMPGLHKIQKALEQSDWFKSIDPNKVIVVAGTNGKGSTCAALEALLMEAGQRVGFYSSPHLISTTERIRLNSILISEEQFVNLFLQCEPIIKNCELSHFEALTFMAGHYFFSDKWALNLDFVIFEVGLGGLFDATNAFPHKYSVITKLGLDHTQILGQNIRDIAQNKFGIVNRKGIVVHHPLPADVIELKEDIQRQTNSNWIEADKPVYQIKKNKNSVNYEMSYLESKFSINLLGYRAMENIMTAITTFHILGFSIFGHEPALNKINWLGRMQKVKWKNMQAPLYLSGDHNVQGIESLIEILKDFGWRNLYLIIGIGEDKDFKNIFKKLMKLNNLKLHLTVTPFKGRALDNYSEEIKKIAISQNSEVEILLDEISKKATSEDLVLVTGSLYLVGEVLKKIN